MARSPTNTSDWSESAKQFLNHWDSLRDGDSLPTSEAFLDNPNFSLQPSVFIIEKESIYKTTFRLMATELVEIWGDDFTGRAVEDVFAADIAARYLANPHMCLEWPCGLWETGLFGNINEREVSLEILYLPLSVGENKPERLSGVLGRADTSIKSAKRRGMIAIKDRHWVDIGQGLPADELDIFSIP